MAYEEVLSRGRKAIPAGGEDQNARVTMVSATTSASIADTERKRRSVI
jgi:hypothetical protein